MLYITDTPSAPRDCGCGILAVSTHLAVSTSVIDVISELVSPSSADLFDLRQQPMAEVRRTLQWLRDESFTRMREYRTPGRASFSPTVLVIASSALRDPVVAASAATTVSQARFIGVHLWLEKSAEIPRAVDINTNTGSCPHCTARRIATGEIL